jgi:hypothetical protein
VARRADGEENGEEGERGRRPAAFESARCAGRRGKRRGVGSVSRGGRRRSREGPGAAVDNMEQPIVAPNHRAQAAALWRDRGGRRGAVDSA